MNEKIIELYKEGREISEIIVELNITYKHVIKAINSLKRERRVKG